MQYTISAEVFEAWPGYRRGVVVVRGAANHRDGAAVEAVLRQEEERVRDRLGATPVPDVAEVAAWREAYRRFGAKPSEHRSSIEAMLRRVVKPDRLPAINPLVDIGNAVSLRRLLPAGVHPLPAGGPDLALRRARDGDVFSPPDGAAAEAPAAPEVVFAQGATVLTRRWTWRQAAGTQTLPGTTDVFFNIDGLPPVTDETVRAAMRDIEQLVMAHTGGRVVASAVLSAASPALQIPA